MRWAWELIFGMEDGYECAREVGVGCAGMAGQSHLADHGRLALHVRRLLEVEGSSIATPLRRRAVFRSYERTRNSGSLMKLFLQISGVVFNMARRRRFLPADHPSCVWGSYARPFSTTNDLAVNGTSPKWDHDAWRHQIVNSSGQAVSMEALMSIEGSR